MLERDQEVAEMEFHALNDIPSGVGVFDVTGSVIDLKYLNDGFYRMIGAHREDRTRFLRKNTIQSVHPEDRPGLLDEALASIREKRTFEYRFRNLNGKGTYMWLGIRAAHKPLDEKTERFYASYYDVDQFVSTQNRLEEYGNQLDAILGNIPGGVAVFFERDGEIRLTYTNAGFYVLHHGSRAYWEGQSADPANWLTPEDRHLFWDEFQKVAAGEKPEGSVVYRVVGEDGLPHWVSNQFRPAHRRDNVQYYYASFIDMDKQIAAEQGLLQEKLMYDDAAKSARLIVWTYDIAGHRAVMMQSGYTREICEKLGIPRVIENVTETLLPYIAPSDRGTFQNAYHDIDSGARRAECEFRFRMPGQDTEQLEHVVLKRITDESGRLMTVYCCGQNITDQKKKEEDYEQIYRQLEKNYPHSLGSFHLNLSKNWCGDGKSPFSFVMKQQQSGTVDGYFLEFSKLIADEDVRQSFFQRFERKLLLKQFAEGTMEANIEYPIVYQDGTRHWRNGLLFMLKNPKTGDVEAVTYAIDIDERKKSEFIMGKLIHDHFDYIGIIHPATKTFEFHSKKAEITFGKVGKTILYEECRACICAQFEKKEERKAFEQTVSLEAIVAEMRARGTRSVTYLKTTDGKIACIRLQYSWLEKEGGDILVVRSDVTEAYLKEQQQIGLLEKEKRAAEAANIAKSEFLSRMSHDIRTPLNGIIGMTYLAQKQENPAKTTDCLTKIDTSSKFLLSLINDILDMAKAESGAIQLHPEPYPAEEFRGYLKAIIAPLCQERNQTFLLEVEDVCMGVIPMVDKLRANQIVFNLLSNAVKYTPEGGIIQCCVREKKLPENRVDLCVDIIDNGIGMSEEFQKILFNPFIQEERGNSGEMRGTGLGLAIAKRLIDAMGGKVSVSSEIGKGTAFHIELTPPCVSAESQRHGTSTGDGAAHPADFSGKHILLCEDHPLNQEIAKAMLEERQAIVTVAGDGQVGVRIFANSAVGYFDCVLMDVHMPIMDGYEATKILRGMARPDAGQVPILAMTADAFADDVRKCLDVGMNGHLAKPIDPGKLYEILSNLLAKDTRG
jgi:signal transduction histidine kinase/CheY-like chemotaxis protein/PAS domain-containing protein